MPDLSEQELIYKFSPYYLHIPELFGELRIALDVFHNFHFLLLFDLVRKRLLGFTRTSQIQISHCSSEKISK